MANRSLLRQFDLLEEEQQELEQLFEEGWLPEETEEKEITVGDIVHITAEEKHWHGATQDSAFSHIALTAKGSTTQQLEP